MLNSFYLFVSFIFLHVFVCFLSICFFYSFYYAHNQFLIQISFSLIIFVCIYLFVKLLILFVRSFVYLFNYSYMELPIH